MHQPRKWWIGLPVLAGLVYGAAEQLTPQLEADLKARVAAKLGVDPSTVSVAGQDVTLSGATPAALAALRDEPGLRRIVFSKEGSTPRSVAPPVAEPAKPAPTTEPYLFSATLGDSLVALDGKIPSDALREKAIALASAAGQGRAVSDGATLDAHAPEGDYATALVVALEALGALEQGKATLSDARLSIEGRGRANVRADTLTEKVKARLPQGFELARIEVAPGPVSPFVFEAARHDGAVLLTGFAPDPVTRARLVDAARRSVFDATVEDRLEIAPGAPPKFAKAAETALAALARLQDGRLQISDAALSLSGAVRHEGARGEIAAAVEEDLPKNFTSDLRLVAPTLGAPLDAASCRAALQALSARQLTFDEDDGLAPDSAPLLDALTATVLRCEGAPIEVSGYWDDRGVAELTRDRSKRRAQRVVDRFVKAGADPFRVWAMGYGGERPLAQNDSEENRARNRRIEFIVKQR